MQQGLKSYLVVTGGYWTFTVTDGALRMLVVLFFHQLGYSPFEIATLFLFYEFFGIVTNLVGGWLGARIGLNLTMHTGMALQIIALVMLSVSPDLLTVVYVMCAQALSGIAKDLNKMSAKASIKLMLPENGNAALFKWVAILTGSKNSLKGIGFFIGGALLYAIGFRNAVLALAASLLVALVVTWIMLPGVIGKSGARPKFSAVFSPSRAINLLSGARFFLFGARDVWFVVALPVFLSSVLDWSHIQVGSFLACWVIGYGVVQALAPTILAVPFSDIRLGRSRGGRLVLTLVTVLMVIPAGIAWTYNNNAIDIGAVLVIGLVLFGIVFALNSAVHSFLAVAWSDRDNVSMNIGFYYMANAGGRLFGTLLSGYTYQTLGLTGCLWLSSAMLTAAVVVSSLLPHRVG